MLSEIKQMAHGYGKNLGNLENTSIFVCLIVFTRLKQILLITKTNVWEIFRRGDIPQTPTLNSIHSVLPAVLPGIALEVPLALN